MNNSGQDRRRNPRLEHNIPLKISSGEVDIVTETMNLSSSGAYCRVNKYIEPMTKLKVQFLLPVKKNNKVDARKISCTGVVVRTESIPGSESYNTAIFFSDLLPKESRAISDFIHDMLPDDQPES